jgi:hypothetical protein
VTLSGIEKEVKPEQLVNARGPMEVSCESAGIETEVKFEQL